MLGFCFFRWLDLDEGHVVEYYGRVWERELVWLDRVEMEWYVRHKTFMPNMLDARSRAETSFST